MAGSARAAEMKNKTHCFLNSYCSRTVVLHFHLFFLRDRSVIEQKSLLEDRVQWMKTSVSGDLLLKNSSKVEKERFHKTVVSSLETVVMLKRQKDGVGGR